jgi:voltage-gated potassium channel Kch
VSWQDALFWMIHPHAIEAKRVHNSTKLFAIFVYAGVFAFQIWVAERVAVTIFKRHGVEAWRTMVNDVTIPFVLIETNEGLCRELLKEKVLIIQGDAKRHDVLQTAGIERARGVCIVIDNDADNLYITVTAKALNPKARIITRAGQSRYAQAMRNSGADEVIIPEYEGGLMTGRMIAKFYPGSHPNLV